VTDSAGIELLYRSLIEHTPDLVILLDQEGLIWYASPATEAALGYAPEKIGGRALLELVHPQDAAHLGRNLGPANGPTASGQAFHCRLQHADLTWKVFEGFSRSLPAGPVLGGTALYLRDVTTRRQSDEALQRSHKELARSNAFISALAQVAGRITTTVNPDQVMETLGREMKGISLACAVMLLDEQTRISSLHYISVKPAVLALVEHQTGLNIKGIRITYVGAPASEPVPVKRTEAGFSLMESQAQENPFPQAEFHPDIIPYLANLLHRTPPNVVARAVRLAGVTPFTPLILLPLQVRDRFLGELAVWGPGLHEGDIKPLSVFANQVAGMIDKATLLDTVQRRAQETDTLREAAAVVTSALDLDQVLDRILTQLEKVVPYDKASIFLSDGCLLTVTACRGFPNPAEVLGQRFPIENPLFVEALQHKKPIILEDAQADPRFEGWCATHTTRGWMGVPLIVRGEPIGYLNLDSLQVGAYETEKAALIQAFANQAAIAIENARLYKQAQHLAITDSLTGLYNRRHFFELASREFERTRRYGHALSMLMWDVDHFKLVNDRFGHIAGDQALQAITQRCREQLREADILGRYGGEEFVALLPETSLQYARQAAERLLIAISGRPFDTCGQSISLSISIGVAEIDPGCPNLEALLERADQALYKAKQSGRNGVAAWG
jgi:diguanylate cyclase (GGDEF)-like protein/PAS domain S-box-containing protein